MGADVYSRLLFGARITILIAVVAVGASLLIGVPIGLVAGYYHGWLSDLLMRVSDVFLAVPQVVLAIAIAQTLGPSIAERHPRPLGHLLAVVRARGLRGDARAPEGGLHREHGVALGASPWRVTALHVLPNIASPIIVRASIGMGFTILTAAALGFLGLGAPPPTPEWGRTIAESREFLPDAWWYATAPGLAIFLTVMGFNLLGDGLRDVLDPRVRRTRTARDVPGCRDAPAARRPRAARRLRHRPASRRCSTVSTWRSGRRGRGARRRERLRQDDARARDPRHPAGAARIRGGEVRFKGQDLLRADPAVVNDRVRGRRSRSSRRTRSRRSARCSRSADPDHGPHEVEVAARGGKAARMPSWFSGYPRARYRADREAVLDTCARADPEPARALRRLPHEFSGGQRQRLMIAMALLPAARSDHRRRADHSARRDDPGPDPPADARAGEGARRVRAVHHARPRHRARDLRPHRGHVRRPGDGGRPDRRILRAPGTSLHAPAASPACRVRAARSATSPARCRA